MTLSAAASPPDVHPCSICTSLLSTAGAPPERPTAHATTPPPIKIPLNVIFLTFPHVAPAGSGPAPDPETVDRLPIIDVFRLRNVYRPENAGGRLPRNAARASARSWVNAVRAPVTA